MAQQIGLVAVLGMNADELADRFPEIPEVRFASSGNWGWLRFDPDEEVGDTLTHEEVAARVGKPKSLALDIRAEGDSHWRLTLYPKKGKPLHVAFHHAWFDPSSTAARLAAKPTVAERLARLDEALPSLFRTPESVLSKVQGKSTSKALEAVKKAQAERVAELIDKVPNLGFDVRPALMGEEPPEGDGFGPLGTLPGFLDALALGKALVDHDGTWVVGPEAGSLGSFGRDVALDTIAPDVGPIDGGPVELPAGDLARFWLLAWSCDTDAETDVLLTPPAGSRLALPKPETWVAFHRRRGRIYVEVAWRPPQLRLRTYRSVAEAIAKAPAGTVVEFLSGNASDDGSDPDSSPPIAGRQRYRGTLTDRGTFLVTHASLPLTRDDLVEAMEICRKIDEKAATFSLASEEDAQAVVAMARGTEWFPDEKSLPRPKGPTVVVPPRGEALFTAMMVFRRRFVDGPWNANEGQTRDESARQEWGRAVGTSVGAVMAAPEGDEVVLQTERATFRRADWSKMNVGVLDAIAFAWGQAIGDDEPSPQTPAQKLEPTEEALADLGFVPLGTIHCDRFGELYLRGYSGPSGDTFACVAAGTFGQFVVEFVTRFGNGASLTTSTTPFLKDQKKKRIYKRSFPDLDPCSLLEKHREGIAELSSAKSMPVPIEATLEGFCRALDDYIRREL